MSTFLTKQNYIYILVPFWQQLHCLSQGKQTSTYRPSEVHTAEGCLIET